MIRTVLSLAVACAALPASAEPARIARIERTLLPGITVVGRPTRYMALAERMAHYKAPAISVAVFDRGRIVWSRAYGQAAPGRPATARTLFQAASISKPVFAAATLRLVHERRLGLDRPINDFLRSWRLPDAEAAPARAVTLRHLLSHSAGPFGDGARARTRASS